MAKGDNMEHVAKIMPVLWAFIEKHKKCSVGITTIGNKVIVTLMWGKVRWKRFAHRDAVLLTQQIQDFLQVA